MRISFTVLLLFSVCITDSIAVPRSVRAEFIDTMEFGLLAGYRHDQIDWNIAGYTGDLQYVNILSELDWDDLDIWQLGGTGKLSVGSGTAPFLTYIRGSLDYGWITDGSVRDSDYDGNDRSMESYRSISATEDDDVLDVSLGLGFEKKFWQDRLTLGFLGGYSYHEQNLRLTNGMQVIPEDEPLAGLNSTYQSKWYGPFGGIDIELHPFSRFSLLAAVEYHWSDYEGEADWNLRDDLAHPVSFRHESDNGEGLVGILRGVFLLSNDWALDLAFVYRDFSASDGIDLTYLASGTVIVTKFNEANWHSSAVNAGLTFTF